MNPSKQITGIILAGGKSSRMGTDKGLLEWRGSSFTKNIIDALQPIVSRIIIISNSKKYESFGFEVYPDMIKEHGPLAGIYTGLHHSRSKDNIVVSCDVPLITTKIFQKLIKHNERNVDIIQLSTSSDTMPLIALYKKTCESKFLGLLKQRKLKLKTAVSGMRVKTIILSSEEVKSVRNVNNREDLKRIQNAANS